MTLQVVDGVFYFFSFPFCYDAWKLCTTYIPCCMLNTSYTTCVTKSHSIIVREGPTNHTAGIENTWLLAWNLGPKRPSKPKVDYKCVSEISALF